MNRFKAMSRPMQIVVVVGVVVVCCCGVAVMGSLLPDSGDETPTAVVEQPTEPLEPTKPPEPTATEIPPTEPPEPTATEIPPTEPPEPTATEIPPTEAPEPTATEVPPTEPPEPTATIEPSPETARLVIVKVDKRAEYVDIENTGGTAQDLTGWVLVSEKGNQRCELAGVIQPGERLRIWAMAEDSGQDGFNCGFGENIWNNSEPDAAVLLDAAGQEIDRR